MNTLQQPMMTKSRLQSNEYSFMLWAFDACRHIFRLVHIISAPNHA
jgi:hypothetical protein